MLELDCPPIQEMVARKLIGNVYTIDDRLIHILDAYGESPDMHFLCQWADTDIQFTQEFYAVVSMFD